MQADKYGRIHLTSDEAFRAIYSGKLKDLSKVYIGNNEARQFNRFVKINGDQNISQAAVIDNEESIEVFDVSNQSKWFMPENYCPDLIQQIYTKCITDEQKIRVLKELQLFGEHNMIDLLHYLKYLVDTMRLNKVVWGVGRGSSVASYVLYLIGVHKIDSLKYDLDINEFLKEKINGI